MFHFVFFYDKFPAMDNKLVEIGKRIEEAAKKEGLSRVDLGIVLEVGVGAVGRYIRGEADAGAIGLSKIAEACSVSIGWLLTGKEPGLIEQEQPPAKEEVQAATITAEITGKEMSMLNNFRSLDSFGQDLLTQTAGLLLSKHQK